MDMDSDSAAMAVASSHREGMDTSAALQSRRVDTLRDPARVWAVDSAGVGSPAVCTADSAAVATAN